MSRSIRESDNNADHGLALPVTSQRSVSTSLSPGKGRSKTTTLYGGMTLNLGMMLAEQLDWMDLKHLHSIQRNSLSDISNAMLSQVAKSADSPTEIMTARSERSERVGSWFPLFWTSQKVVIHRDMVLHSRGL